jgi:excisionase family DNA binding protein
MNTLRRKSGLACSETSGDNRILICLVPGLIQVSRKKLYELINTGELESYTEGKSRRITVKSINDYIERRLAAEAVRHGRAASYGDDQSRP